jgi:hypothetical protein
MVIVMVMIMMVAVVLCARRRRCGGEVGCLGGGGRLGVEAFSIRIQHIISKSPTL